MQGSWPLVGRAEELELVAQALFRHERTGIVLAGEAGVGKTRLAREVVALAEQRGLPTAWGAATEAGRGIPFGAVAHLLPPALPAAYTRHDVVRAAGSALLERAHGRRLVLGIDDAHLLDEHSAVLIHQLAQTGEVAVVATVRSGPPAPDPVAVLWKDGLCARLELFDLSESEVEQLLEAVLEPGVERGTLRRLFDATKGNPLYLRELVQGCLETGTLAAEGGLWRWTGPISASPRLRQVITSRIGWRSQREKEALEVVAAAEPVETSLLEIFVSGETLAALEEALLVTEHRDGSRRFARLAHPLYTEAIRSRTPPARARAIAGRLADSLEAHGARRREDLLRLASWRLQAGLANRPEILMPAAGEALRLFDFALAEQTARAAVEAGAGHAASLLLAQALMGQGAFDETDELLARLEHEADSEPVLASAAAARATNLFWNQGRGAAALNVLAAAEKTVSDVGLRNELEAQRVYFMATGSRDGAKAIPAALAILERPELSDQAVLNAVGAAGQMQIWTGRPQAAAQVYDRWSPVLERAIAGSPYAPVGETIFLVSVGLMAGQLEEAAIRAERAYAEALEGEADWVRGFLAGLAGSVARAQGRARSAVRWLQEAVTSLRDSDVLGQRWSFLANLAHGFALLGAVDRAEAALREAEEAAALHQVEGTAGVNFLSGFLVQARVWTAAARGETTTSVAIALEGAERNGADGIRSWQALLLHDVARLGQPEQVAEPLARVVEHCDGQLFPALGRHAAALAEKDAPALLEVSKGFENMGAHLLAAEAAAEAARAYREDGQRGSALAAAQRARALAGHCEGATTPALAGLDTPLPLTRREREVATLAARGLSNQAIAGRLVVSARTVGNHLHNVYGKLGLAGREDLRAVLGPDGSAGHGS